MNTVRWVTDLLPMRLLYVPVPTPVAVKTTDGMSFRKLAEYFGSSCVPFWPKETPFPFALTQAVTFPSASHVSVSAREASSQ